MSIGQVWMPLGKIWNMALSYKLNKIISMSLKLEPNARNDQLFVIIYILLKQSKTSKISLCISTSNFYFIIIGRGRAHGTHRESGERGGEREQTIFARCLGLWNTHHCLLCPEFSCVSFLQMTPWLLFLWILTRGVFCPWPPLDPSKGV